MEGVNQALSPMEWARMGRNTGGKSYDFKFGRCKILK